jgi:hypothetical protein
VCSSDLKEKPEGPFDLKEFTEIKKNLLISNLNFDISFGQNKKYNKTE